MSAAIVESLVVIGAILGFLWATMLLAITLMWLAERNWSRWMRIFWAFLFWPLNWYDRRDGT